MKLPLGLLAALSLAVAITAPATAIIPPRDCGFMKIKGHRYNVKADQLRCSTARDDLRRYAVHGTKPGAGWTCRTYRDQKLRYRCYKGKREFFGIRRS